MKVVSLTWFAHQESGALQAIDAAGPCKVLDKHYELFSAASLTPNCYHDPTFKRCGAMV